MSTSSFSAPVVGRSQPSGATLVRYVVITWCVLGALSPLLLYAYVRFRWPEFAAEFWAHVSGLDGYPVWWGVSCGLSASCAYLLVRRSRLAVWAAAAILAWHATSVGWSWLQGEWRAVYWGGLATCCFMLAVVMLLRARRVLQ